MISAKDVFHQLTAGPSLMDSVCNFIIRPPRSTYEIEDLGPEVFRIGDDGKQRYMRHDFELENMRGLRFQCSWFKPYPAKRAPCVVYCHANCGGRYDALEALFVLREGFSLFCFDFCGSGMSEGEYISLGFYERQDLAAVIEFLMLKSDEVDGVALWGRSMGAVASIMYASKDPWIRCIVCDSPFATLRLLINDLVERHGGRTARVIPKAMVRALVERIRKRIMKRAAFDIDDLDTVKYAKLCSVPAMLFYGSEDDFVSSNHCELVRDAFPIPCLQHYTPGGHNDERDEEIQQVIAAYLHLYLIDKPQGERERQEQQEKLKKAMPASSSSPSPAASQRTNRSVSPQCDEEAESTEPSDASRSPASQSPAPPSSGTSSSSSPHRFYFSKHDVQLPVKDPQDPLTSGGFGKSHSPDTVSKTLTFEAMASLGSGDSAAVTTATTRKCGDTPITPDQGLSPSNNNNAAATAARGAMHSASTTLSTRSQDNSSSTHETLPFLGTGTAAAAFGPAQPVVSLTGGNVDIKYITPKPPATTTTSCVRMPDVAKKPTVEKLSATEYGSPRYYK